MQFVLISIALSLITALAWAVLFVGVFTLRWHFWKDAVSEVTIERANWGAFRIGTLHSLIVTLTFSSLIGEYERVTLMHEREAVAVENLYHTLSEWQSPDAERLQGELINYASLVVEKEWPSLDRGENSDEAGAIVRGFRTDLIEIAPSGAERDYVLRELTFIEDARSSRLAELNAPLFLHFWLIGVIGFLFTLFCFFVHPPSPMSYVVVAFFSAINGMIFLAIFALANPFAPPMGLQPSALSAVIAKTM